MRHRRHAWPAAAEAAVLLALTVAGAQAQSSLRRPPPADERDQPPPADEWDQPQEDADVDDDEISRRLVYNNAIDACPQYWTDYFAPEALEWVCACETVLDLELVSGPDTTHDLVKQQKACPTTTQKSKLTSQGPTTTTKKEVTITTTKTTTSTTKYCEACDPVTAGPTTGTSTTTITSMTGTITTTSTLTTSTSSIGTTGLTNTTTASTATTTRTTTTTRTVTTTTGPSTPAPTLTTTSATFTSTTKTTTNLLPCSICPLYHFLCPDGCTNCVAPGMCRTVFHVENDIFDIACDHRRSIQPPDPCVDFTSVQVSCPAGNLFPGRKVIHDAGEYPQLKCRTCGIHSLPEDASQFRGRWVGKVSWGPNQYEGIISETEIHSYKLYVVDAMYQKLGDALHTEEVRLWATLDAACCDTEFYSVQLDLELPQNYTYFMVVPVTIAGLELNVGPVSRRIRDLGLKGMAAGSSRRSATSASATLLTVALLAVLSWNQER